METAANILICSLAISIPYILDRFLKFEKIQYGIVCTISGLSIVAIEKVVSYVY